MRLIKDTLFSLALAANLAGCARTSDNSGLPKPANEITIDDINDPAVRAAQQRWIELAAELQLVNDGSADAIKTPSGYFSQTPSGIAAFASLTNTLAAEHLKTAATTGCAGIESFERIGKAKSINLAVPFPSEIDGADWYLMRYRRLNSDGGSSLVVNGALVSIPTLAGKKYPVIEYAHAGDAGLSTLEIAAVFAELQKNHFIVAPAFPGESICKFATRTTDKTACDSAGRYFDAVGTSNPYSTDSEDLLAAHHCLVTNHSLPDFSTLVTSKIKTQSPAGSSIGLVPVSYMVGSSRGGMAALIALAKNSAMHRANASAGSIVYPQAKYFNCAATNINPTTFSYDEFRIFLEAVVKGTASSLAAYSLPTAPQLNDLLKDYREGRTTAVEAARLIQSRDATFNASLALDSLRNWSSGDKGSLLTMHATLDTKIPLSQGMIGANVFAAVNALMSSQRQTNPTLPAGVHLTALATVAQPPYSTDGGKSLTAGYSMHGDLAWFYSLAGVSTATLSANGSPAPLDAGDPFLNKKPTEVFSSWIENTSVGCAAAAP